MKPLRRWVALAAIVVVLLTFVGAQCRGPETASVMDEVRLCGHIYQTSRKPISGGTAFIKLTIKGQRYAFKGKTPVAIETVDHISVGENVNLDANGLFCTSKLKLGSFHKPETTKIVSLTARIGEKAVEGFLVTGGLGRPDPTGLYAQAFFNFAKPFDGKVSRFMNDELKELFSPDRKVAAAPSGKKKKKK